MGVTSTKRGAYVLQNSAQRIFAQNVEPQNVEPQSIGRPNGAARDGDGMRRADGDLVQNNQAGKTDACP
jgi:hypothetical protein